MPRRESQAMSRAMQMVKSGMVPRQAAQKAGIALSTMYRSPLYKEWRDTVRQRTDK